MKQKEKTNGFKFALSALTALVTFSYISINILQQSVFNFKIYIIALAIVSVTITVSMLLFIYIIILGFSFEVHDQYVKKKIENLSTKIYISSFFVTLLILIIMIILSYLLIADSPNEFLVDFFMIVSIIITGYVYHRLSKSQQRILQNNYMHNIFNWNEIPGKDCFKFTHFLIKNFDVNWVKTGKFEKTEGGKKLYIQSENNYLTLQLNDEKTEAKLTIDETNKCIFKVKNDNLYIHNYTPQLCCGWDKPSNNF